MFSASAVLNKLPKVNYKDITRHHRRFTKKRHIGADPGIEYRKEIGENNEEVRDLADHDFDLEADFMRVGISHNEHMQEIRRSKEKQSYLAVKQKYFKEKFPNFLTWSDKEQIRYLYRADPEEWTIEKLSDGFPALPNVIAKIATSNWTKKNETNIHSHDELVKQNWKLFKEKKFQDLPENLVEHLKKFIHRDSNIQPFKTSNKMNENTTKSLLAPNIKIGNEFSNIITSYERLKNKNTISTDSLTSKKYNIRKPPKEDTFMMKTNVHSTHLTLDRLRERVETKAKYKEISQDEQLMLKAFHEETEREENITAAPNNVVLKEADSLQEKKNKSNDLTVIVKERKDYSHLEYPESINIPKKLLKQGCTYKLNDCYYDDDGEFLYRVPGMDK